MSSGHGQGRCKDPRLMPSARMVRVEAIVSKFRKVDNRKFAVRKLQVFAFLFLAFTLNHMGEPSNPKASRIWFSRKRSKEKCSFTSRSVKRTNVGGATAACVM